MSLDVVTASTDRDLTTTAALKMLVLGATATSTVQDAQFSALIRSASKWAETFVGYPMTVQTYREARPSYGRRNLMLSRTPLRSVADLFDATDTGTATQILTSEFRVQDAEAGLLSRNEGFAWSAPLQPPGSGGPFLSSIPLEAMPLSGQEYEPWLVDYSAGWTYAGVDTGSANYSTAMGATSTGRTLPEDLEFAVQLKAQALYVGGDELASEKLGDMETNYRSLGNDKNTGALITRSEQLLEPYRRQA